MTTSATLPSTQSQQSQHCGLGAPRLPRYPVAVHNDETSASTIDSHHAFGALIASVHLSESDWQHLVDEGFVTVRHHRESHDGDSIIELTIKREASR